MRMKNSFIALLLILTILLSACGGQPKDTLGSTGGSATDLTVDSTEKAAQDTTTDIESKETTPVKAEVLTPAELNTAEDVEAFIRENKWYLRALGCVFEKPEDIPARLYFYGGVGADTQATGEELDFILNAFRQKNPKTEDLNYAHNYMRLPAAKMNEALTILGVTVEDIQIPDSWAYNEKLDCYYFWVSDAYGVTGWSVTKVEKGTEGIVAAYWESERSIALDSGEFLKNPKMVLTMQQQPDGTYRVLSNVPQT